MPTLRPRSTPVLVRDGVGRLIRLGRGDTRDSVRHLMIYAMSVVRTARTKSLSSSVALISHWYIAKQVYVSRNAMPLWTALHLEPFPSLQHTRESTIRLPQRGSYRQPLLHPPSIYIHSLIPISRLLFLLKVIAGHCLSSCQIEYNLPR